MDANYTQILMKIGAAILFGGLIGIERESTHRPAGLRTHILVCVGATLVMETNIMLMHQYASTVPVDPARIGAQVISGIGFLGAGTIMKEGASIKGLTTAASLWVVGCLGLAIGSGYFGLSFTATLLILIVLQTFRLLEKQAIKLRREAIFYIELNIEKNKVENVVKIFNEIGCKVKSFSISQVRIGFFGITASVRYPKEIEPFDIVEKIIGLDGIVAIEKVDQ
jgi:putative Mg2+ transporter-C (MgtC) family protein